VTHPDQLKWLKSQARTSLTKHNLDYNQVPTAIRLHSQA